MKVHGDRGGFVLAFVVFMLFAVSVAAATGYLVVTSEYRMADQTLDGSEALAVAHAGLLRFVSEQIGVVDDTVSYALGDGVAVVTSRRLFSQDSVTDVYFIRSEASVADIFAPNTPARRVVGGFATHRRRPLRHIGALISSADTMLLDLGGRAQGWDHDTASECTGGGASPVGGLVGIERAAGPPGDLAGSPPADIWPGGYLAFMDSVALRWDVLSDPEFPVDFDGIWPDFSVLPADSFPVIRQTGWLTTNVQGRGVLIVDGVFDPGTSFHWDGIVLAGHLDDVIHGTVEGLVVGGLESSNVYGTVLVRGYYEYHSCESYAANESLSYLELDENTVFEIS